MDAPAAPSGMSSPARARGRRSWRTTLALLLLAASGVGAAAGSDDAADVAQVQQTVRTLTLGDARVEVDIVDATPARAEALETWIGEVAHAVEATFGTWPLARSVIRITQVEAGQAGGGSPVPWGQTSRRGERVAVLLFVRRDAGIGELRDDWTAAHELVHLYHPYLGREGRWLAEGLASYYQNVVRARAGLMSGNAAWRALDAGFGRGRRDTRDRPLAQARRGETMRVYWAGAAYWLEADLALRARGSSLDEVLAGYAECCLAGARFGDAEGFVAALDRVAGREVFAARFRRYAASRAFPDLGEAYLRLGLRRGADGLHFDPAGAALRARIMAAPAR
ncbi:hypothetical protein [Marilutibacter chinensis]|uniref:M61 glycyl aminopeptidase n=1 Tax=Marilutibacter chinensis TaxID=2912247 RepID=A0ABS9HWX5_9GAMM|nr:hypothetical protein [Lysobacter chinensis]MCF7222840.1 hypothetical protein [Lysobacter chinensis]